MIYNKYITHNNEPKSLQIIHSLAENQFTKCLKNKSNINVLDVGPRVPVDLMSMYHEFDTSLLLGLELLNDEVTCVSNFINNLMNHAIKNNDNVAKEIYKNLILIPRNTFYNVYLTVFEDVKKSLKNRILNENEFNKLILDNFKFNTSIENYFSSETPMFDFITCQNVLHFVDHNEKIITKMKSFLKEDGFVFISVENNRCENFNDQLFLEELNKNFPSGNLYIVNQDNDWYRMTFINFDI